LWIRNEENDVVENKGCMGWHDESTKVHVEEWNFIIVPSVQMPTKILSSILLLIIPLPRLPLFKSNSYTQKILRNV
jgi:hypothetical protein